MTSMSISSTVPATNLLATDAPRSLACGILMEIDATCTTPVCHPPLMQEQWDHHHCCRDLCLYCGRDSHHAQYGMCNCHCDRSQTHWLLIVCTSCMCQAAHHACNSLNSLTGSPSTYSRHTTFPCTLFTLVPFTFLLFTCFQSFSTPIIYTFNLFTIPCIILPLSTWQNPNLSIFFELLCPHTHPLNPSSVLILALISSPLHLDWSPGLAHLVSLHLLLPLGHAHQHRLWSNWHPTTPSCTFALQPPVPLTAPCCSMQVCLSSCGSAWVHPLVFTSHLHCSSALVVPSRCLISHLSFHICSLALVVLFPHPQFQTFMYCWLMLNTFTSLHSLSLIYLFFYLPDLLVTPATPPIIASSHSVHVLIPSDP